MSRQYRIVAFLRYRTPVNKGPETTAALTVAEIYASKITVAADARGGSEEPMKRSHR